MEAQVLRDELLPAIERWREEGQQIAFATVVRVVGTAPRREGAKLAVTSSGEMAGSVSGGCVEADVMRAAMRVLKTGSPELLDYGVTADMITDVGLSCGGKISIFVEPLAHWTDTFERLTQLLRENRPAVLGTVIAGGPLGAKMLLAADGQVISARPELAAIFTEDARNMLAAEQNGLRGYDLQGERIEVFIESFPPPRRLVIVGAVHIAIPLHRIARILGYHVMIVDPRPVLATTERFPLADLIVVEWPGEALESLALDSSTAVVVLTHDPKFDHPALVAALRSDARYVGAIGSRTTNESRMDALRAEGLKSEDLDRICAPVGLDIGAQTPAEIALSIMSEIVATLHGRSGGRATLLAHRHRGTKAEG